MSFDFDKVIPRRNTHSQKWDSMEARLGLSDPDTLPMWVADMDFPAPPAVSEYLAEKVAHGVYGYFGEDAEYKSAICDWMRKRHQFDVNPDWIVTTHGVVAGVGVSLQAFSEPGDGVVVFSPVYHAFGNTIRAAGRKLIESPLKIVQGRYEMDLETLPSKIDDKTKIVVLCSPHNPGGRVWTKDELVDLCKFCKQHNLILVSDEIHHDLIFDGRKHWVTANACPEVTDRLVTLTAATKTFNIAGCLTGNAIISNKEMRSKFKGVLAGCGSLSPNGIGVEMVTAAYAGGEDWVDAVVPYIQANRDRLDEAMVRMIPGVRVMKLEATYLAWYDFTDTHYTAEEATDLVQKTAKIGISRGLTFGEGGENWLRFNIACPRPTLDEAIGRLQEAFGA